MQKIRFFFILFMFPFCLLAQQRTKIILQDSKRGTTDGVKNISYLRNPVFRHDNATLSCDSAVYYESRNVFEAFNNVHINQGDTINIYSDHLTYDGNTKIAHLTSNVKMIDRENTLTTNVLDYNMGTKIGTYVNGGKIVNKDITLTSKNGYYFSRQKDAYFRYDVVAVSATTVIKSDTLRYNTGTNWAYFYGPTNIKGKDDNLYTENGAYNTKIDYAYFGKKNLYTNGSKSLKGDSLYYDGIAGYGKAVKNIVFKDTSDKTVLYGQLGHYYKKDQRAVVTKNAYVGMASSDSIKVKNKMVVDSLWMGADTLETQMVLQKSLKLIESPVLKKDNELGEEEKVEPGKKGTGKPATAPGKESVLSKRAPKEEKKESGKKPRKGKNEIGTDSIKLAPVKTLLGKDSVHTDSIPIKKPDIINPIKTLKDSIQLKSALKLKEAVQLKDTLKTKVADSIVKKDLSKKDAVQVKKTISEVKKEVIKTEPKIAKADSTIKKAIDTTKTKTVVAKAKAAAGNVLTKKSVKDSAFNPMDTVRTRSIKAYHNVRVYKANMQAVADSLFYTSADSTLRWYGKPILWSQGSQQTGDTIYLRLKNKKLNTLQVLQNGFMVNVNADSVKFNQIKGKLITAFFKDGELSTMFVDGNAESVYYNRDKDSLYTDMNQTVSSRIKILFKNKEIAGLLTIKDPEGVRVPIKELKEDVLLTGFIWKPELRPLSKKEVISGKAKVKAQTTTKGTTGTKKPATGKTEAGKLTATATKDAAIPDPKNLNKTLLDAKKVLNGTLPAVGIPAKADGFLKSKADSLLKQDIKIDTSKVDSVIKKLQSVPLKKI